MKPSTDRFWEQPVSSVFQEHIKTVTGKSPTPVWIGLRSYQKVWRWVDNTSFKPKMWVSIGVNSSFAPFQTQFMPWPITPRCWSLCKCLISSLAKLCRPKIGDLYWSTVTSQLPWDPYNNLAFHVPHMLLADFTAGTATLLKSGHHPARNDVCTVRWCTKRAGTTTPLHLSFYSKFGEFPSLQQYNFCFTGLGPLCMRWMKGVWHWEPRTLKLIDVMLNTNGFAKKTLSCSALWQQKMGKNAMPPSNKHPPQNAHPTTHLLPIFGVKQSHPHS